MAVKKIFIMKKNDHGTLIKGKMIRDGVALSLWDAPRILLSQDVAEAI